MAARQAPLKRQRRAITVLDDLWKIERLGVPSVSPDGRRVVLVSAVSYHGSTGLGYPFLDRIAHRFGALELQDVEAASHWLKRHAPAAEDAAAPSAYTGQVVPAPSGD